MRLDRRDFLRRAGLVGCSAAAAPLITPVTFASAPGDARFVVIILRGAMDGLDVVQPLGDRNYAGWRKGLSAQAEATDLDGFYALHPALSDLMPLWQAGELAFAHAVSTPYRDKRSHFDGQDFLENGGGLASGRLTDSGDGWLNRMLPLLGATHSETALAVGRQRLLLLEGDTPTMAWSPDADLDLSPAGSALLEAIYRDDPLFRDAAIKAEKISAEFATDMSPSRGSRAGALAAFAASRLVGETRIAAFSLSGFDTHRRQAEALPRALRDVQEAVLTLRRDLGPVWERTAVLAITEFGRTVAENGSGGTDHGTGGAMLMAGGAVRGGRVLGRWPGLSEAALYQRRDLMPTNDLRRFAGWAMRGLFGVPVSDLERQVFPGLDMGDDPALLL